MEGRQEEDKSVGCDIEPAFYVETVLLVINYFLWYLCRLGA